MSVMGSASPVPASGAVLVQQRGVRGEPQVLALGDGRHVEVALDIGVGGFDGSGPAGVAALDQVADATRGVGLEVEQGQREHRARDLVGAHRQSAGGRLGVLEAFAVFLDLRDQVLQQGVAGRVTAVHLTRLDFPLGHPRPRGRVVCAPDASALRRRGGVFT
jgi:hypothetical protein